jgi:hypothetical protein
MKSPKTITKTAKKAGTKNLKPVARTVDPLYVIFEQHLFNFADPDSDRKSFIVNVVNDYLSYLRKNNIIVPKSLEQPIVDELCTQVNTMLVRKIYGCINRNEFSDPVGASARAASKRAKTRVSKTG